LTFLSTINRKRNYQPQAQLSTTSHFGFVSFSQQPSQQFVTIVTLDFDYSVFDGTAGPTKLLHTSGDGFQIGLGEWQSLDERNPLPSPALGLTRHPHDAITFYHLLAQSLATTAVQRILAVRTQTATGSGINGAGIAGHGREIAAQGYRHYTGGL